MLLELSNLAPYLFFTLVADEQSQLIYKITCLIWYVYMTMLISFKQNGPLLLTYTHIPKPAYTGTWMIKWFKISVFGEIRRLWVIKIANVHSYGQSYMI